MKIVIILLFCIIFYVGYTSTFDGVIVNKIIDFKNPQSLETDKKVYNKGDLIKVKLNYCKHRAIEGTAYWQIVDGFGLSFASRKVVAAPGCRDIWIPIGNIPKFFPPSNNVHIEGETVYKLNGLNTIRYSLKSQTFSIQ